MFKIFVEYSLFGVACQDTWQAPDEKAKECMLKSAKEYGFTVIKVEVL